MTTILMNIIQGIFRPSIAALSIALAVAIVTVDKSSGSVTQDTINLSALGCGGLLKPICSISFF